MKVLCLAILILTGTYLSSCKHSDGGGEPDSPSPEIARSDDYPYFFMRPFDPKDSVGQVSFDGSLVKGFESLSFIDSNSEGIREAILRQTWVSHPWLRAKFKRILDKAPPELLRLATCTKIILLQANTDYSSTNTQGVVGLGAVALAFTDEEKKSLSPAGVLPAGKPKRVGVSKFFSSQFLWTNPAATPAEFFDSTVLQVLIHEFVHACDTNQRFIPKPKLNTLVKPIQNQKASDLWFRTISPVEFDLPALKEDLKTFDDEVLKSGGASIYGMTTTNENVAELVSLILFRKFMKEDVYEILWEVDSSRKLAEQTTLFGVKNLFCEPAVYAEGLKLIQATGLYDDINLKSDDQCHVQFLSKGKTIREALTETKTP